MRMGYWGYIALFVLFMAGSGLWASFIPVYAEEKVYDVIVIGAGVSGITAADALRQLGYDVVVLEAKDRSGGRLWTDNSTGIPLDLGASWIHGIKNNPIYVLTQKYGINTTPTVSEDHKDIRTVYDFVEHKDEPRLNELEEKRLWNLFDDFNRYLFLKYSYIPINELEWRTLDRLLLYEPFLRKDAFSGKSIDDVLDEFLKEKGLTEDREIYESLASYWYTNTWATDIPNISARHYGMERQYSDHEVIFPGGYSQIIDKLTEELDIRHNHVVTKVDYRENVVKVTVVSKTNPEQISEFKSFYVLSTLPLGVLKDSISNKKILDTEEGIVKFVPDLPSEKKDAINKIGMGTLNKVFLIFDEPFWTSDLEQNFITVLREDETQWALFFNFYKYLKEPILLAFNSGKYGQELEKFSDEEIVDIAMSNLRDIYPNAPYPKDYKITRWSSDPFTRGSYSYTAVNSNPADYRKLAENVNARLFFAGEATVPEAWGTVHGAYLSGIRAANEIDFWSDYEVTLKYYIWAIVIISVVLAFCWFWFLRWKINRQMALDAMGKNEVAWRSTAIIIFTIIFVASVYYFAETQFALPPDIFEYSGVWDDECFHITQLMEAIPYMQLSPEKENVYYLQYERCINE